MLFPLAFVELEDGALTIDKYLVLYIAFLESRGLIVLLFVHLCIESDRILLGNFLDFRVPHLVPLLIVVLARWLGSLFPLGQLKGLHFEVGRLGVDRIGIRVGLVCAFQEELVQL
jgi:hypothetical protein